MLSHKIRPARGLPTLLSQKKRWTAKPEDVGYDPSWGEHHGPVEFDADPWNYGTTGIKLKEVKLSNPYKGQEPEPTG